jgi:hypothetical protein
LQRLNFPVHLFDVITLHGQLMASVRSSAFQYLPSVTGFHALAKAMNTHPATDFGLPSSLGHPEFLLRLTALDAIKKPKMPSFTKPGKYKLTQRMRSSVFLSGTLML